MKRKLLAVVAAGAIALGGFVIVQAQPSVLGSEGERRRSRNDRRVLFSANQRARIRPRVCSGRRAARKLRRRSLHGCLPRKNSVSEQRQPQPCFFFKENKTMMTPSAATIAAAVNPTVEISARE